MINRIKFKDGDSQYLFKVQLHCVLQKVTDFSPSTSKASVWWMINGFTLIYMGTLLTTYIVNVEQFDIEGYKDDHETYRYGVDHRGEDFLSAIYMISNTLRWQSVFFQNFKDKFV